MWVNTRVMVLVLDVIRGPVGITKSTLFPPLIYFGIDVATDTLFNA